MRLRDSHGAKCARGAHLRRWRIAAFQHEVQHLHLLLELVRFASKGRQALVGLGRWQAAADSGLLGLGAIIEARMDHGQRGRDANGRGHVRPGHYVSSELCRDELLPTHRPGCRGDQGTHGRQDAIRRPHELSVGRPLGVRPFWRHLLRRFGRRGVQGARQDVGETPADGREPQLGLRLGHKRNWCECGGELLRLGVEGELGPVRLQAPVCRSYARLASAGLPARRVAELSQSRPLRKARRVLAQH
mmetsp:Transcript_5124/g.12586  ORF Transcript_5124/g.12586 Transcript_5124/m.12586 type:complete len:246 (+) Transcript_5124:248-985(+)